MATGVIKWLTFGILALVGFFVIAGALGFLFPETTGAFGKFYKENVNDLVGKDTIKAGEVFVESKHLEAIDNLKNRIKLMKDSKDDNCFLSYTYSGGSDEGRNGFPLFGEKGTSLLIKDSNLGMRISVLGGADGLQEYSSEVIEGIKPCVISGGKVPANFYKKFILGKESSSYFNSVNEIKIYSDGDENRISYNKGKEMDFEDNGLLFKSGNNVCFFPTTDAGGFLSYGCDGDSSDGLDDDCLREDLATKYNSREGLLVCSKPPRLG